MLPHGGKRLIPGEFGFLFHRKTSRRLQTFQDIGRQPSPGPNATTGTRGSSGFQEIHPMGLRGIIPDLQGADFRTIFLKRRLAATRLRLNDSAFVYQTESSVFGRWVRISLRVCCCSDLGFASHGDPRRGSGREYKHGHHSDPGPSWCTTVLRPRARTIA